MRFEVVWLQ